MKRYLRLAWTGPRGLKVSHDLLERGDAADDLHDRVEGTQQPLEPAPERAGGSSLSSPAGLPPGM